MIRDKTMRCAPAVLALGVLLSACGGGSSSTDAASAGDTGSTEPTPTSEPTPAEPTYSPRPGEVIELPRGRTGWATMRQGRYAVHVTPTLDYEVDVPDQWKVLDGEQTDQPAACPGPAAQPGGPGRPAAQPTRTSDPDPAEPTYLPDPGEVIELPRGRNGWARLRQGRYAAQVSPSLSYEVDVPDRWDVLDGRYVRPPTGEALFLVAPAPAGETEVPQDPCGGEATRVVGPTVSDLAGELRSQPVLDVTEPVPVTLDGHQGLYLEVRIPGDIPFGSACFDSLDDTVALFSSGQDGWSFEPGFVGRWWILDVDGERVVVMSQCDADCTTDDVDAVTTMAEAVTFAPDQ